MLLGRPVEPFSVFDRILAFSSIGFQVAAAVEMMLTDTSIMAHKTASELLYNGSSNVTRER